MLYEVITFKAPRNLNAPVFCIFSHLKKILQPHILFILVEVNTGVFIAYGSILSAASIILLIVIINFMGKMLQ